MIEAFRRFWYNNVSGEFKDITREQIQVYGGPSRDFDKCHTCQMAEWRSRVQQRNLFPQYHKCPTSDLCAQICAKQGDDAWTNYHQDFSFELGVDPDLDAPKCVCLFGRGGNNARLWERYWNDHCDQWMINLRRQLAQACQVDVVLLGKPMDWDRYDFAFYQNHGGDAPSEIPIPLIMYGHDIRENSDPHQRIIDQLEPEVLLTPCPTAWKALYDIPGKVRFHCHGAGTFFARPNLGKKRWDLLVVGALGARGLESMKPRRELDAQIRQLKAFDVKFSHHAGHKRIDTDKLDRKAKYLNAWSEFLGSARYVIFGPKAGIRREAVWIKTYECLGSGAITIMPSPQDLSYLGVEPYVHYIPLSDVWGDNKKLAHYLSHYDDYRHIAESAVAWHQENVDRMLFDGFESVVQEITSHRYPRRLV
jgi:hypothetical protein